MRLGDGGGQNEKQIPGGNAEGARPAAARWCLRAHDDDDDARGYDDAATTTGIQCGAVVSL